MKTKYKYMKFKPYCHSGDGRDWACYFIKTKCLAGVIYVFDDKQIGFCPTKNTGFTFECLIELIDFMNQLKTGDKL